MSGSEPVVVLAVQADEAAHAPVRAALKAIDGTALRGPLGHDAPRAALAALEEHPHDAFLVDRELHDPATAASTSPATILAQTPHAPVILLDDAADRETDLAAAAAGVADYLVRPSPATLERSLRYAIAHQRALKRLAESEERHALALQGANDGLWDWDVRADRLYFSPRWKAMLGYTEADIGDAPGEWLGRVHPDDRAALTQALDGHLGGSTQHFESEHRIQHRDGSYRWMLARGTAVRDHTGRATRVVGSQTDVTDRREAEQRLQHDAMHDALTGLPNRVLFLDRLAQAIRRAAAPGADATCAAVLFLDLDRFKLVNDSLGHHVGDRLLIAVARRLESALRPGDTVARLGGDEFTILLDDVGDAREATVIAERVQHALREPFHLDGRELVVAASIGIALADQDAAPADVMRDADVAMYRAKADGKGRHAVFDARMHERVMRRLDMESDLRRAIEEDGLEVVYQPIVQVATGRIVGFEALCRWLGPYGVADRAGRVRADRRGDRADRPARAPRARDRVPRAGGVARAARRRGARRSASTSRTASSPSRASATDLAEVLERTRAGPARAAPGGQGARPRARAGADPPHARPGARGARRALADRRLRHGRLLAAPAAPLPRRRGEDLRRRSSTAWAATAARSRSSRRSSGWPTTSGSR